MKGQENGRSAERDNKQGADCSGMTTTLATILHQFLDRLPADEQLLVIEDTEEALA
ncbi:MAG: hypothetical protein ACYCRD_04715 [Leptospirillum sp.]